jgi:hypothetical protein
VSLAGRGRWSWTGLGFWLANASLALLIVAGLLAGPELADVAWDRGVHVTPAQTALHAALVAAGFSHHHVHAKMPLGRLSPNEGPTLQSQGAGTHWGTRFTPAVRPEAPPCLLLEGCPIGSTEQRLPAGVLMPPPTPPPQAA